MDRYTITLFLFAGLIAGCGHVPSETKDDRAAAQSHIQGHPVEREVTPTFTGEHVIRASADDKPPSGKEIDTLIQQLVSPNRAPDVKYGIATYPKGYDRKAQELAYHAWGELSRMGIQAFPYLIDHFDDDRYCFTKDSGPGYYNWSVGRACADIFICHLQPYDFAGHFALSGSDSTGQHKRPYYSVHYKLRTSTGARLWWATRKDKSLLELQIETLEWVIAEEAKTPASYSERERAYLNDTLAKLRTGKTPLPPYVPWSQ